MNINLLIGQKNIGDNGAQHLNKGNWPNLK